jgi:hypothetical protein
MKMPRFTIAWIMVIIVVAAIDLAAIRALDGTRSLIRGLLVWGSMPMASILVLGIPSVIRGLSGSGKIHPFLIRFELVGWTVLLVYTGSAILFPEFVGELVQHLLESSDLPLVSGTNPLVLFYVVLIPLLPQLALALVGGWLNQLFKIRITIERRRMT